MKEASYKGAHSEWFHLYEMFRTGESIEMESRLAGVGTVVGSGEWGVATNGNRVSFGGSENILELDGIDDCTTLWMH